MYEEYGRNNYERNNYGGYPNQPMQHYQRDPYDGFDMPPAYPDFGGYNAPQWRNRQMPGNEPWMPQSAPRSPAPAQTNPIEGCEHSAAAVRQCRSYDPSLNLEKIPGYKDGDPEQDYLGVQQRKIWYLLWCQENGCEPCIQVSGVSMVGEFLQVSAKVLIDGKVVGQDIAGIPARSASGDPRIIQTLATQATGRALADAGFGTLFCNKRSEIGDELPCDGGVTPPEQQKPAEKPAAPRKRASAQPRQSPTEEKKEAPERRNRYAVPQTNAPIADASMSFEEASNFVVQTGGVFDGMTLSQLFESHPKALATLSNAEDETLRIAVKAFMEGLNA